MKKIGRSTYEFEKNIYISGAYSLVGKKEGDGPFGKYFSKVAKDDTFGQKTFEKAERMMHEESVRGLLNSCEASETEIDLMIGGDILNQIVTSNYSAREFDIPFVGVYSACSSFTEALQVASVFIESGGAKNIVAVAGSHFSAAERQYRNPLEFGNQRQTYSSN